MLKLKNIKLPLVFLALLLSCLQTSLVGATTDSHATKALPAKISHFCLGSQKAPVVIYEFLSLSCPYCAQHFRSLIQEKGPLYQLIKQGKVKLEIKNLPIHGPTDFLAHKMLQYATTPQQYFSLASLYLNHQEKWFQARNPQKAIENYAKLVGIPQKMVQKFRNDKFTVYKLAELADHYVTDLGIKAAPTTVIATANHTLTSHCNKFVGITTPSDLANVVKKLLAKDPQE